MSELEKVNVSDIERLAKLREPFPVHQISKLPKPTKAQNDCPSSEKINCSVCGGWHHSRVIHLDYVGHAALTDRLLDVDPLWHWEPMAFKDGLPAFDETGGLWIRLFVLGHSRIGYGHAAHSTYKEIGSREKEVIGDALRNAAMRFGAALELWHKGQLHAEYEFASADEVVNAISNKQPATKPITPTDGAFASLPIDLQISAKDDAGFIVKQWDDGDKAGAFDAYMTLLEGDADYVTAVWGLLKPHSAMRSELKRMKDANGRD